MHKLSALLLLLFWFSVDTASAQSLRFVTDNAAPIELKAGDMVWQRETGHAVLSDAARFAQGPLSLSAARIDLSFAPDGTAQTMTAEGDVVLVSRDKTGTRRAEAARAELDLTADKLVLLGNVSVTQMGSPSSDNNNTADAAGLMGGELTVDMVSGRAILRGGGDKPRARIELR